MSPGAAFWVSELWSECYTIVTTCQMSVDVNNYDLQNVDCQGLYPVAKYHQYHQGLQNEQLSLGTSVTMGGNPAFTVHVV